MKKCIIILAMLASGIAYGQDNAGLQTPESKFTYCEIVGNSKFMSTKVTVSVDFGEEKSFWAPADTRIKDEATGKVQAFNSMVDALNYMGSKGWEFVQAYVVTMGTNSNVYHWLLKKKK